MRNYKSFRISLFVLFLIICSSDVYGEKIEWDLQERWGVTQQGIINAIKEAKKHFQSLPNDSIIILIPEGTFDIGGNKNHSINISNIKPGQQGRLIFKGAGKDKTILIATDREEHSIYGRDMYRITFEGIHFTRDYCTVLQGTVVSVATGEVILDLHDGFPTPDSLWQYGIVGDWGLYFKKYTNDIDNPQILTEDNDQIAWDKEGTYKIEGKRWKFALRQLHLTPDYKPGDIIGIKLKHGGQTYWLANGGGITFKDCKWTQKTRGVLRMGISNIKFIDCVTGRGPRVAGRVPCLASPGGGPQCGQPNDPVINNVLIENCVFIASGDDNVAFFNVNGGIIKNCRITDSFARGIFLYHCQNICLKNNTVERCPVLWDGGDGSSNCDDVTGILYDKKFQNDIEIYPNPFTSGFFIRKNSQNFNNVSASLYNLMGQNVFSANISSLKECKITPKNIQTGFYLLNIRDVNNTYSKILIKK